VSEWLLHSELESGLNFLLISIILLINILNMEYEMGIFPCLNI